MERLIKLSGSFGAEGFFFRTASMTERLSAHVQAQVTLESEELDLVPEAYLGKTICLEYEMKEGGESRFFDGVITSMMQASQSAGGRCEYIFDVSSWTWLLSNNQEFKIYQNESVIDIIKKVFGRNSHSSVSFEDRTQASYRSWEYCVQYSESDFNFVARLMEQEGLYFFFEHNANKHTLVMVDSPSAHVAAANYATLPYNPAAQSGRLTDSEFISGLKTRKSIRTPRHMHNDYNFKMPSADIHTDSTGHMESYNASMEVFEYPGEYDLPGEGAQYSRVRQEEQLAQQQLFDGDTAARGLRTGYLLTPICDDMPLLAKEMLLISTTIRIVEAEPEAHAQGHSSFHCSFTGIPAKHPFRAERKSKKPQAKGPLPAIVVGPKGDEIYTDSFGRVKVQFYWDRYGKNNESSSCWIRVAYPVASRGWGFVAIPRIGQEVVVSFEDGDPDRPLITGVVYNAEQNVPYPLPDNKTVSGWRSHSTLNGSDTNFNEMRFEDKKGQEYIWFQAEKDYFGLVKNDSREEIQRDVHRLIKRDRFEEIQQNYSQTVVGKYTQQVNQAHITVDDDFLAKVVGALNVINEGHIAVKTAGDLSVKSDASTHLKSAANIKVDAGSELHLKAGSSLNISSSDSICLKVGGSSLVISSSGITINGVSVAVNAGGGGASAAAASPAGPDSAALPILPVPPVDPLA